MSSWFLEGQPCFPCFTPWSSVLHMHALPRYNLQPTLNQAGMTVPTSTDRTQAHASKASSCSADDRVLGCGTHTDCGFLTILYSDGEGLEVCTPQVGAHTPDAVSRQKVYMLRVGAHTHTYTHFAAATRVLDPDHFCPAQGYDEHLKMLVEMQAKDTLGSACSTSSRQAGTNVCAPMPSLRGLNSAATACTRCVCR